jgi:GNAT superfamily N-acetyltransferase
VELRRATEDDAEALAALVLAGFATYREFAPPEWEPPPLDVETRHTQQVLADADTFSLLAEDGGEVVGQVTALPALKSIARRTDDAKLAHLRHLFVAQSHWGAGLAKTLDDAALEHARDAGFTAMRLFTPAAQARARRFYEREGWRPVSDEFFEPPIGLTMVEYRIDL